MKRIIKSVYVVPLARTYSVGDCTEPVFHSDKGHDRFGTVVERIDHFTKGGEMGLIPWVEIRGKNSAVIEARESDCVLACIDVDNSHEPF